MADQAEPETVAAMRSLTSDMEQLHAARDQVQAFSTAFEGQIHMLECFPIVADSAEEWYERSSIRTKLDIDPDQGVQMLRQVRAMFDNVVNTYDRELARLKSGARELLDEADEDERKAYQQDAVRRLVDHLVGVMPDEDDDEENTVHTADLVAFSIDEDGIPRVLLVERGYEPFKGKLAIPGGKSEASDLTDADTAVREFAEEVGLTVEPGDLVEIGTFDQPGRDPRGDYATVAYSGVLNGMPTPTAGSDAAAARWVPLADVDRSEMAFDHFDIVARAYDRHRHVLGDLADTSEAFQELQDAVNELHAAGVPISVTDDDGNEINLPIRDTGTHH